MAIFHIRALAGSRTSIDSSPILLFWWEALVWANLDLRPPVQRNSGAQWPLGSWSHLLQRAFSLQVPQFGQTGRPSHNPSLCFFPPMCVMSHETQRRQACCLANHYGRETSQRWWRQKEGPQSYSSSVIAEGLQTHVTCPTFGFYVISI